MLEAVLVLDANLSVEQARTAVTDLPGDRLAVVRRAAADGSPTFRWYAVPLAVLGRLLAVAAPAATLGALLDTAGRLPTEAADATDPRVRGGSFVGVVVHGATAIGYAGSPGPLSGRVTRRIDFPAPAAPASPAPISPPAPTAPTAPAPTASSAEPTSVPTPSGPTGRNGGERVVHPRVDVPAEVAPGAAFEVDVGLGERSNKPSDSPMTLSLPRRRRFVELTVQVVADGFTAPSGVKRALVLPRDDLFSASVRIPLVAPAIDGEFWRGRVEVEYAVAGTILGRSWRDVVVRPDPTAGPSITGGDLPLADADIDADQTAAVDLTVSIAEGARPGRLVWTFTSPHPLDLPDEPVATELPTGNAQAFALKAVAVVSDADGTAAAEDRIQGIARTISGATPVAFWTALTTVWLVAKGEGRVPRVLLVAAEPHVPWELASTEKAWIIDRTLVDEFAPQVLGAQCQVGRWTPAGPLAPDGARRPPVAPEHGIQVRRVALVVGDYHSRNGTRALPFAEQEGEALGESYPCVRLSATLEEFTELLGGRLADAAGPVATEVLHVACHGGVDPDDPASNGIVLSDSALRIDEFVVLGGELAEAGAPLVFLNACQLAQSGTDLLGDQGGLARAFLSVGGGFVAPLWSVDDELARDMAVDFYRYTLGDGLTVGEALRRLRARFSQIPGHTQTTPLAYVYYGHPDLRLELAG